MKIELTTWCVYASEAHDEIIFYTSFTGKRSVLRSTHSQDKSMFEVMKRYESCLTKSYIAF
jgi:hypothetical protein